MAGLSLMTGDEPGGISTGYVYGRPTAAQPSKDYTITASARLGRRAILVSLEGATMRRLAALLLLTALLAQACASAPPPSPHNPPTLAEVNNAVEDEPVTVELRSGEVVREVEGLVMTAESTTWFDGHRTRTVPTAEVCRVIRLIRRRAGKGYAWGLLACAPVALAAGHSPRDPLAALGNLLLTEGLCPFIGMFLAAAVKVPPDRVVYTAPESCGSAR